jgi:hypothetical protein
MSKRATGRGSLRLTWSIGVLAAAVASIVGCEDESEPGGADVSAAGADAHGDAGTTINAGPGAGLGASGAPSSGGTDGADGAGAASSGQPGSGDAGRPSAGAPQLAGAAGDGGAANACAPRAEGCQVNSDCALDQHCQGECPARLCIRDSAYCDEAHPTCTGLSAGCDDRRCLPPLALGATCAKSTECLSHFCNAKTHECEVGLQSGAECDYDNQRCEAGLVCDVPLGDTHPEKCVNPGDYPSLCQFECVNGTTCYEDYEEFALGQGCGLGRYTGKECDEAPCAANNYCGFAHELALYPICLALPGPGKPCLNRDVATDCPGGGDRYCDQTDICRDDSFCDAGVCRARGRQGESCAEAPCDRGLRCADAFLDGRCE